MKQPQRVAVRINVERTYPGHALHNLQQVLDAFVAFWTQRGFDLPKMGEHWAQTVCGTLFHDSELVEEVTA